MISAGHGWMRGMAFVGLGLLLPLFAHADTCVTRSGPSHYVVVRDTGVSYVDTSKGVGNDMTTDVKADATTFHVIPVDVHEPCVPPGEELYGKDKSQVYYKNSLIFQADPATFAILDRPEYARDAHAVFLKGQTFTDADPKTVRVLLWPGQRPDAHGVVAEVPGSPENMWGLYVVDARHVWKNGTILASRDPASFALLYPSGQNSYTEDRNGIYKNDQFIGTPSVLNVDNLP
jgi:hypothetical protein